MHETVDGLDKRYSQGTHEILDGLYVGLPICCALAGWGSTGIEEHDTKQRHVRD